jgi:hypothetical protein
MNYLEDRRFLQRATGSFNARPWQRNRKLLAKIVNRRGEMLSRRFRLCLPRSAHFFLTQGTDTRRLVVQNQKAMGCRIRGLRDCCTKENVPCEKASTSEMGDGKSYVSSQTAS